MEIPVEERSAIAQFIKTYGCDKLWDYVLCNGYLASAKHLYNRGFAQMYDIQPIEEMCKYAICGKRLNTVLWYIKSVKASIPWLQPTYDRLHREYLVKTALPLLLRNALKYDNDELFHCVWHKNTITYEMRYEISVLMYKNLKAKKFNIVKYVNKISIESFNRLLACKIYNDEKSTTLRKMMKKIDLDSIPEEPVLDDAPKEWVPKVNTTECTAIELQLMSESFQKDGFKRGIWEILKPAIFNNFLSVVKELFKYEIDNSYEDDTLSIKSAIHFGKLPIAKWMAKYYVQYHKRYNIPGYHFRLQTGCYAYALYKGVCNNNCELVQWANDKLDNPEYHIKKEFANAIKADAIDVVEWMYEHYPDMCNKMVDTDRNTQRALASKDIILGVSANPEDDI